MLAFLQNVSQPDQVTDTTALNYWFNLKVGVCLIWILGSFGAAIYIIARYEKPHNHESTNTEQEDNVDDGWRPSLTYIHPAWLLIFRALAFFLLLILIILHIKVHGVKVFYFYAVWTFTLNTLYFWMGIFMSIYGCYRHYHRFDVIGQTHSPRRIVVFWSYTLRIIFHMQAGAIIFALFAYWVSMIFYQSRKHESVDWIDTSIHSVNLSLLLVETTFNSLRFSRFRIAYFIIWTCIFVGFQWILHAYNSTIWWSYDFLVLSAPLSPLRYFVVVVSHVPCYGIFMLVIRLKRKILLKLSPTLNQDELELVSF